MREGHQQVGGELEPHLCHQGCEARRLSVGLQKRHYCRVREHVLARCRAGEEKAAFLEGLADGGDTESEAAFVERAAGARRQKVAITGVQLATRKDHGAGGEAGSVMTRRHQHLKPAGSVPQQHQRRGGNRSDGRRYGRGGHDLLHGLYFPAGFL